MSRKYLLVALVIAVALALTISQPTLAAPGDVYARHAWIIINKPDGTPFSGETLTVVIFNETGNCILAAGKVTAAENTDGNITLTIFDEIHHAIVEPWPGTTYNISIFWDKYDRTFLLFTNTTTIDSSHPFFPAFINQTVVAEHYWEVWFRAMTDLNQDGDYETPLVFKDVELGIWDLPYFKVFDEDHNLIWEAEGNQSLPLAGGAEAYAVKPFQAGTIVVELSQTRRGTPLCLHIDNMYNFTIYKETYWRINENSGTLPVKVGEEELIFNYSFHTGAEQIFYTDLIEKKLYEKVHGAGSYPTPTATFDLTTLDGLITTTTDHIVAFENRAYTFLAEVVVVTPCGANLTDYGPWIWPPVNLEFETETLGKLRLGLMEADRSRAPEVGFPGSKDHTGFTGYFWLPNVTAVYDENVTLKIEIMGVQVFHETFNTTQRIPNNHDSIVWSDAAGQYLNWTIRAIDIPFDPHQGNVPVTGALVSVFWANVSVVETDIIVKNSGPNPVQPLTGAKIVLLSPAYDPVNTITDYAGHVQLPPFGDFMGGTDSSGGAIIARRGVWPGLLPVPFDFRTTGDLYTYRIQVFYPLPGTEHFVDVTPEDNEIPLNLTLYLLGDPRNDIPPCETQVFEIFAKVYAVNFKVVDMCNRPLTTRDDPRATVVLTWTPPGETEPAITFPAGLGPDGVVFLGAVPGGEIKVQLAFKGVLMDPIGNNTIIVDTNVWNLTDSVFTFPVGDLTLRVTQWDVNEPLANITVTINYYKNDELMFTETQLTDMCNGTVTFEKVPLRVSTTSPATNKIIVELYTNEYTPYIRPQDAGLLVGKWDLTGTILNEIEPACNIGPIDIPAWIFSFTLEATDHEGKILKEFKTDTGTAWIAVALNDTTYPKELNLTEACLYRPCPCTPNITVTYELFNWTGHTAPEGNEAEEARFLYTSSQYHETGGKYPHLFVAGANYSFIAWYGGVIVYNYTITLPRPSAELDWKDVVDSQVVLFNESDLTTTVIDGESLDYDWKLERGGEITHPILRFYGAPWWKEGGERYSIKLQLITWVIDLHVFTLSNAGEGLIPGLNLTLVRQDVINQTMLETGDVYSHLTHRSDFYEWVTGMVWSAVDDNMNGEIVIPVGVWTPARGVADWHVYGVKFGSLIKYAFLLAGSEWGTPNVPDTPYAFDVYLYSYLWSRREVPIYGYVVGPWNFTTHAVDVATAYWSGGRYWATSLYPEWYKLYHGEWYGPFRANLTTPFIGGIPDYDMSSWNVTLWSGAWKVVRTTGMDGFCACVHGPDFRDNYIGLAKQPVKVTAIGETGATSDVDTGVTGDDGCAQFMPDTGASVETPIGSFPVYTDKVTFKFDVSFEQSWVSTTRIAYEFKTWLNLDEKLHLGDYGLTTSDVIDADYLTLTIYFSEDHNKGNECVDLYWDAIKVTVYDWAGRPLKNAMVAAILREPRAKSIPSVIDFTYDNGSVILYVPPSGEVTRKYQLLVFWRDSYLLYRAGKIPKEIVIFDTVTDYDTPRTYAPGSGTTLETFVYIGIIKLLNANGEPLSPEALSKITVTIKWPDQVVTQHKPLADGRVMIILNKDTVKSWPADISAMWSPDTPANIESQAPHGAYTVTVDWSGLGTIATTTINIEKGRFETSRQVFEVRLDVVNVELAFKSPFDTPLAGATVEIKKPDGETLTGVLNKDGKIIVAEVPPGKITATVKDWKGLPIGFTTTVDRTVSGITVPKIGKLTVKVTGSRGQGLEGATVVIDKVGTFSTDAAGTVTVEVPSGSYKVTASKGGRTASTTATVTDGKITTTELKLDIFITIAGWELSSSEFLGLLLLTFILIIILFIIAHEYSAWRRRRLAKVITPTKEA